MDLHKLFCGIGTQILAISRKLESRHFKVESIYLDLVFEPLISHRSAALSTKFLYMPQINNGQRYLRCFGKKWRASFLITV